MVIGGHFGSGDHFDGGDHFGGGTSPCAVCLSDSTWLMHKRNREVLSQIFRPNNNYE